MPSCATCGEPILDSAESCPRCGGVGWGDAIWWNIVPASIGNLIGGAVLVALLSWYTYGRTPEGARTLRRTDEVIRARSTAALRPREV